MLSVKTVRELEYELIVGMDFFRDFDIEIRLARCLWRANDGEWKKFAGDVVKKDSLVCVTECVEINEIVCEEREINRSANITESERDEQFSEGDLIIRKTHTLSSAINKFSAKFAPKFEAPYKIVEVESPSMYALESDSSSSQWLSKVHVSELKRYVAPRAARKVPVT